MRLLPHKRNSPAGRFYTYNARTALSAGGREFCGGSCSNKVRHLTMNCLNTNPEEFTPVKPLSCPVKDVDHAGLVERGISENHAREGRKSTPTRIWPKYMYERVLRWLNSQSITSMLHLPHKCDSPVGTFCTYSACAALSTARRESCASMG